MGLEWGCVFDGDACKLPGGPKWPRSVPDRFTTDQQKNKQSQNLLLETEEPKLGSTGPFNPKNGISQGNITNKLGDCLGCAN